MRDVWIRARDGEIDASDAEMALQALRKALALLGRWGPGAQPDTNCNNFVTFPFFLLQFRYNSVTFLVLCFSWGGCILQGTLQQEMTWTPWRCIEQRKKETEKTTS